MIARRLRAVRPSLVPLIDVLFILLVYFMVTSVYRDLDMISVLPGAEAPGVAASAPSERRTLLIRVAADGSALLRGRPLSRAALEAAEDARLLVLPSPEAPLSALVEVLDRLALAGRSDVELVRLEPRR